MDELLQSAYTASKSSNGVIYITFEDHGGSGGAVQPAAAPENEDSVDNKVEGGKHRKEISEDEVEDDEVVFAEEEEYANDDNGDLGGGASDDY